MLCLIQSFHSVLKLVVSEGLLVTKTHEWSQKSVEGNLSKFEHLRLSKTIAVVHNRKVVQYRNSLKKTMV